MKQLLDLIRGLQTEQPENLRVQAIAKLMEDPEYSAMIGHGGNDMMPAQYPEPFRETGIAQRPYTTPGVGGRVANPPLQASGRDMQEIMDQQDYTAYDLDPDEWPETAREFKTKFRRNPATDSEVEHYDSIPEDAFQPPTSDPNVGPLLPSEMSRPDLREARSRGLSSEDELKMVEQGMGVGGDEPFTGYLDEDLGILELDPTPENIEAFIEVHGEENLPEQYRRTTQVPDEAEEEDVQ